jgi:hypothetical protein
LYIIFLDERDRLEIWGWVSLNLISETEKPGFLLLEDVVLRSKRSQPADDLEDPIANMAYLKNSARGDQRSIKAQANISQDLQRRVWRLAFESL